MVPDRDGKMTDVILGFDNIQDYMTLPSDFGASIGRYANRIAGGTFELDGQTVVLDQNDGPNCLHGGAEGWQYQVYEAELLDPQRACGYSSGRCQWQLGLQRFGLQMGGVLS